MYAECVDHSHVQKTEDYLPIQPEGLMVAWVRLHKPGLQVDPLHLSVVVKLPWVLCT